MDTRDGLPKLIQIFPEHNSIGDTTIDIVAVHGIETTSARTWTAHERDEEPRGRPRNWLRDEDMLSQILPQARILVYEYNSNCYSDNAQEIDILGLGESFLAMLDAAEDKCIGKRSLLFIGSCFGGVVVAQALARAFRRRDCHTTLLKSTIGVIFLGTPLRGTATASIAKWLVIIRGFFGKETSKTLLKGLEEENDSLENLIHEFAEMAIQCNIQIRCFYETHKTQVGRAVMSGLQIPKVMLVSRVSACLPGHPRIPLNVRHSMMNKFRGPEDGSFVLVSSQLKDIACNSRIDQARTEEERKCLQLLTSNYMEDKNRIEQRVPGTCTWFLKHPKFLNWYQQTTSSLLYVSADPGCGKTVLSRALIDDGLLSPDIRTPSICYFFFKDDDISRQSGAIALCAILHQLFIQKPTLLKHAIYDFENHGTRLRTMFTVLWDILEKSVADEEAGEVICVFDALDECEDISQKELIRRLGQFHSSQSKMFTKSKFLVTSRPYYGIGRAFRSTIKDMASISLRGEDEWEKISKEIDLVIDNQIPRISSAREVPFTPEVQDGLIKHLKDIPHRTYLWLHLMLNAIRESLDSTAFRLERLVSKLPRSIEDAYEKILRKVDNDSECAQEARTLLHIVVAAVRPLTIQEMNLALAVNEKVRRGQSCQSYDDLDMEYEEAFAEKVRNLCGLFVTIVSARIYLIHQTAKEFLVAKQDVLTTSSSEVWKYSLKPVESNSVISKICLCYLLLDEIDDEIEDETDDDFYTFPEGIRFVANDGPQNNFLNYAGENWCTHIQGARFEDDDAVMCSVLDLFDTQSNRFRRWIQVYLKSHPSFRTLYRSRRFTSLTSASYVGVPAAVKLLLLKQDNAKLYAEDDVAASLECAILGDHIDVVEILLKRDRNLLNGEFDDGSTPLSNAVALGSLKMTQFLLKQADINPNLGDYRGRTPLFLAAGYGDLEIVEELLREDGISLNSQDNDHRTPLIWAAAQGQSKVVYSLLRNPGVEPDCRDKDGRTPLSWAAAQGHFEVVKSLLRNPAVEPDCKDKNGQTPFSWAAVQGQSEVVDLLLKIPGVEPDCKDGNGRTPLSWAAAQGQFEVVKSLLSFPGVEPDSKDETDRTPLSWAAAQGQSKVMDLLLRIPGIKPDRKDKNGQTYFSWAASEGKFLVVEQLLRQYAIELNLEDGRDRTPLLRATQAGRIQVVRLLLAQNGINPYSKYKEGKEIFEAAEDIIGDALDWWPIGYGFSDIAEVFEDRVPQMSQLYEELTRAVELLEAAKEVESADKILFQAYEEMSRAAKLLREEAIRLECHILDAVRQRRATQLQDSQIPFTQSVLAETQLLTSQSARRYHPPTTTTRTPPPTSNNPSSSNRTFANCPWLRNLREAKTPALMPGST